MFFKRKGGREDNVQVLYHYPLSFHIHISSKLSEITTFSVEYKRKEWDAYGVTNIRYFILQDYSEACRGFLFLRIGYFRQQQVR